MNHSLNARRKHFCEAYAACGNAAQAAREAGYSEKTAKTQGQYLLTLPDVAQYVRELQDTAADARIASISQVKAFWSDILNDPKAKTTDRLKASELLAKSAGAFREAAAPLPTGNPVVFLMPDNGRPDDTADAQPEELESAAR